MSEKIDIDKIEQEPVMNFKEPKYKCPVHGETVAWMTFGDYDPGKAYCQKCYWDNVIKPNCQLLEEI